MNGVLDKKIAESEICMEKTLQENIELRKRLEKFQGQGSRVSELEHRVQSLTEQNQSLSDQIIGKSRSHEEDRNRLLLVDQENKSNKALIENLKNSLSLAEYSLNETKASLSAEAQELRKRSNSIPELNARIVSLERDLRNAQDEISAMRETILRKDQEVAAARRDGHEYKLQVSKESQSVSEEYRKLQAEYNNLVREYENARRKAMQGDEAMKKVHSEFDRLQEIISRLKAERLSTIEKVCYG